MIDTSAWTKALRRDGDPVVRTQVQQALVRDGALWCDVTRVELRRAVKGEQEFAEMRRLDSVVYSFDIHQRIGDAACEYAYQARIKGMISPVADLLTFACARVEKLEVIHADHHFDLIAGMFPPAA